jgi:hypothetical protein
MRVVVSRVAVLVIGMWALQLTASPAVADPAVDGARLQNVPAVQPATGEPQRGTVNLQGFAKPLDSGSLGAVPTSTTVVSIGGGLEAGALAGIGTLAKRPAAVDPGIFARPETGLMGGFAGYRFGTDKDGHSGYGINLQIASDPMAAADSWQVQPGLDYRKSLSPAWQVNSRLFSTYALGGPTGVAGTNAGPGSSEDGTGGGFRDVGLSLGFGYAPSESWTVQTQAAYARQLRAVDPDTTSDGKENLDQFFGGVIINYKF